MRFKTTQIKGKGRGKKIGFPTINLRIPKDVQIQKGVWAVWVEIDGKKYKGALHFGPVPTFNEKELSLEVYLIDKNNHQFATTINQLIEVELMKKIRDVKKFVVVKDLIRQIDQDIKDAARYL